MKKLVASVFLFVFSFAMFAGAKSIDERLLGSWDIKAGSKFTTIVFSELECSVYNGSELVSRYVASTYENKLFIDNCGYSFEFFNNGNSIKLIPYFESASVVILERKK